MTSKVSKCPRCGGSIPNEQHAGQYPGAISRLDNATEICSSCGTAEAMWQIGGRQLPPIDQPVR